MEIELQREMHQDCWVERESLSWRRVRDRQAHRGVHMENEFAWQLVWKVKGSKLHEFLKPVGLNAWSFKVSVLFSGKAQRTLGLLLEEGRANSLGTYNM